MFVWIKYQGCYRGANITGMSITDSMGEEISGVVIDQDANEVNANAEQRNKVLQEK